MHQVYKGVELQLRGNKVSIPKINTIRDVNISRISSSMNDVGKQESMGKVKTQIQKWQTMALFSSS